jgi:hypothetical protein
MFWTKRARKNTAALLITLLPTSAMAEQIIVKSGGPSAANYPPGKKLPATANIALKTGDVLTILDGKGTRTLRGPGSFNMSTTTSSGADTRTSLTSLLTTNRARRARTGAVRNVSGSEATKTSRSPNLWFVDISQSTTACVNDLTNIQLWRPDQAQPLKVKISDVKTGASTSINYQKNQSLAIWQAGSFSPQDGASYAFSWAGLTKPVAIRIVTMGSNVEGLESTASALITKGCEAQLNLLVETVAQPDSANER